jgi:hypothetical protein
MRINLKGLNFATKRLADGTLRAYWYAWRGGPLLRGEPGTPEFIASYNAAIATKAATPQGVILSVLQGYQASEDFRRLAASTRRGYVALITRIEKEFADFPLSALTDRRTRGIFMAWRDNLAASSGRRQADCVERARPRPVMGARPRHRCREPLHPRRPALSRFTPVLARSRPRCWRPLIGAGPCVSSVRQQRLHPI